jgi:FkbM family methyltransferase
MLLDPLEWAQISLLQDRIIEPKTVELFKQLLKCGDVYLDVGAHIGFHSLVARVLVDQAGRVIAVEPQPYNCDRILNNWRVNGFDNLKLYLAVAGAGPDMVELHNQSPTDKSRLTLCLEPVNDLPQVFVVPMLTLESLIERNRVGKVKLLKIDAEGYEAEVLRGLGDSVSLVENIVLEVLYDSPETGKRSDAAIGFLREHGFELRTVAGAAFIQGVELPENNLWAARTGDAALRHRAE